MDNALDYKTIIKTLMEKYATLPQSDPEIRTELIIDEAKGHYEILSVGWQKRERIHHVVIHIDIVDDKVWLQHDATDLVVAEDLVRAGIPRESIVLGFRPPHLRKYTDYATT